VLIWIRTTLLIVTKTLNQKNLKTYYKFNLIKKYYVFISAKNKLFSHLQMNDQGKF